MGKEKIKKTKKTEQGDRSGNKNKTEQKRMRENNAEEKRRKGVFDFERVIVIW